MSYLDSREYLYKFQTTEKSFGTDWVDAEEETANYIWLLENIHDPKGFLSYKVYILQNTDEFLYIVKIYVLNDYRGEEPILINDERVSQILFRELSNKGINILTLESADEKLDTYYESLGFKYNETKSKIYSEVIDIRGRLIMVKEINKEIPEEEKQLFGEQ